MNINSRLIKILTLCLFICVDNIHAENKYNIWRDYIYEQFNEQTDNDDINSLFTYLTELENDPLDINTASKKELELIPFLNSVLIENIHYYIYRYGDLKSLDELILIDGFDKILIDIIKPFLRVNNNIYSVDNRFKDIDNGVDTKKLFIKTSVIIDYKRGLYKNDGYVDKPDSVLLINPDKKYLGSPFYSSVRYMSEIGKHIKTGFVFEKDKGEKMFYNDYPYVDYLSFFVEIKDMHGVDKAVIGSYKIRTGAGLVLNNCYYPGKSSFFDNAVSGNSNIKYHNSSDEVNFFNGVAIQTQHKKRLLTMFFSFRNIDSNIENNEITGFRKDGKHNTVSSLSKRDNVNNIVSGIHYQLKGINYKIGLLTMLTTFDKRYAGQDVVYKKYQYKGRECFNSSIDYSIKIDRINLSGETAYCDNNSFATVNKLGYNFTQNVKAGVIYRRYSKRYNSFYSKSFSEGGYVNNEEGVALQIVLSPVKNVKLSCFGDMFRFPYMRYGVSAPSKGYEYSMQAVYKPFDKILMKIKYNVKECDKNGIDSVLGQKVIVPARRDNFYLNIYSNITEFFACGVSATCIFYEKRFKESQNAYTEKSEGSAVTIFLNCKQKQCKQAFSYTVFNTQDYSSRIYFSDRSDISGLAIPSFYGSGVNISASASFSFNRNIVMNMKFNQTRYYDRDEIGSGLEKIKGNVKNDLSVQIKIKL